LKCSQSHNISARQIRDEAQRRREAAAINPENGTDEADEITTAPGATSITTPRSTSSRRTSTRRSNATSLTVPTEDEVGEPSTGKRRTKSAQKAIDKIKASKKNQKKRKHGDDDSDDDDFDAGRFLNEKSAPLPGQMENCAMCAKRFTVTPYSRASPDGGLLCNPCGKDLDKENPQPAKKKVKASGTAVGSRRKTQSRILDGTYVRGAKSLMTLCVEKLAKNINLADDLGDLSPYMVDRIARILAKKRLLDPKTLNLFLQPRIQDLALYDGAKLSSDDYIRVMQTLPALKSLKIRNAIQFKDEVMDYLLSRTVQLDSLYLHGANLLSEEKWHEFLQKKGRSLRSLKVYYTDKHFGNDTLELLTTASPGLRRLKVSNNPKVEGAGVAKLELLENLEHQSLDLQNEVHPDIYVSLLSKIGKNLRTLSIKRAYDVDNTVLDAIHSHCRSLVKLRITESEVMTDAGFVRLFSDWQNPPLQFLDLQKNRQRDAAKPRENPDNVGLCANGFKALMAHSGKTLRYLNVHACRNITADAFEEVFTSDAVYPELRDLEISFCEEVTDFVVGSIFRSCPSLRQLNVFGCMKVKDVIVPPGKLLVGVPNAVGMQVEGDNLQPLRNADGSVKEAVHYIGR
jgi:DNA repair protein RAD7